MNFMKLKSKTMIQVFALFSLVLVGYFVVERVWKNREGFQTYQECIDAGYTKSFCVQTPSSVPALGPGSCVCADGRLGRYLPGFRGECVCGFY